MIWSAYHHYYYFKQAEKGLGMSVTNENYFHREVKSRLNILSSGLLYKMVMVKIYKTIILPGFMILSILLRRCKT
jgi:hypothetical protein